jgi:glycerate 2-kinase
MPLREIARQIFLSTLARVDVTTVMQRKVLYAEGMLRVANAAYVLKKYRRIQVVSVGKAAAPMAEALMQLIRPHLLAGQRMDGIAVGTRVANDPSIRSFLGGHPTPNEQSSRAAAAVLEYLGEDAGHAGDSLVFFLISGGASAMLEQPLDARMTEADTAAFHQALVRSGLKIEKMNVLRKHFSAVKGGRLAVAAGAATKCTLLISDVPGDALHIVGSGPTLPDPSTVADCLAILAGHREALAFPAKISGYFAGGTLRETPKEGLPAFACSSAFALLSSEDLCVEAAVLARAQGFHVEVDDICDEWAYEDAARYLLERIAALSARHAKVCLLSAGEISVQLVGAHGVGGRNQHFVLECARRLDETGQHATVLSAGSDGIDGNSRAAGGIADETTVVRAAGHGLSVAKALASFDSYPVLETLGDAVITGPSGNNVRDLRMLLVDRTGGLS